MDAVSPNDTMIQLINSLKNENIDWTGLVCVINTCVILLIKVDEIVSKLLFLKRKLENFLKACRLIVTVYKYCSKFINYIGIKVYSLIAWITRRNTQVEQEHLDENNNVESHLENSTLSLQRETPQTPNGASQCSMRNNDVVISIESLQSGRL